MKKLLAVLMLLLITFLSVTNTAFAQSNSEISEKATEIEEHREETLLDYNEFKKGLEDFQEDLMGDSEDSDTEDGSTKESTEINIKMGEKEFGFSGSVEEGSDGTVSLNFETPSIDDVLPSKAEVGLFGAFTSMVLGWSIVVWVCLTILGLAVFVFHIMMIIDCAQHDFKDKTLWLALLIIGLFTATGWIIAPLYYFLVKRPR
ncbi:hypothetical protein GF357_04995 [Candidatus Dojkabacteria bacterium]|nr:hypothetical protein [Candidatus Dojkabacteria bacterium]